MKKETQENLRSWLSAKIRERGHGTQLELAKALGVPPQSIGRMLKPQKGRGFRVITAAEITVMTDFFGENPPGFAPAATYPSQRELLDIIQNLSAGEADWLLPFVKVWREQASKAPLPLSPKKESK